MWSGMPLVRSWTASTTSRGAGSSPPRISVVATAVSSSVRGRSRYFLGVPLAQERARHSRWIVSDGKLVGPVTADQQQRPVGRMARKLADHLEAQLIGPVEVVEDQHRRPVDRFEDPVRGGADDQPPRPERIAVVVAIDRQEVLRTGCPNAGVAAHPGRHLPDRCERDLVVLRSHGPTVDPQPGRLRLPHRRPDEASLSEPRLAGQEQGRARGPRRPHRSAGRTAPADRRGRR